MVEYEIVLKKLSEQRWQALLRDFFQIYWAFLIRFSWPSSVFLVILYALIGLDWLLIKPNFLLPDWWMFGGLCAALVYALLQALSCAPSLLQVAQSLDQEAQLPDLITTAFFFINHPRSLATDLVLQEAAQYLKQFRSKKKIFIWQKESWILVFWLILWLSWHLIPLNLGQANPSSVANLPQVEKTEKPTPADTSIQVETKKPTPVDTPAQVETKKPTPAQVETKKPTPVDTPAQVETKKPPPALADQVDHSDQSLPRKSQERQQNPRCNPLQNPRFQPQSIQPLFGQGASWMESQTIQLPAGQEENTTTSQTPLQYRDFQRKAEQYLQKWQVSLQHRKAITRYFELVQPDSH